MLVSDGAGPMPTGVPTTALIAVPDSVWTQVPVTLPPGFARVPSDAWLTALLPKTMAWNRLSAAVALPGMSPDSSGTALVALNDVCT